MKLSTTFGILIVAFIISLCGFIVSVVKPQSDVSDILMMAALFIAAASGITASVFTKKLAKSKQWVYLLVGGLLILLGFALQKSGTDLMHEIFIVLGAITFTGALGFYIYLNLFDFHINKWIWFLPLILIGCLLKFMHWYGGNIILFGALAAIAVIAVVQLLRFRNYTKVKLLQLVGQVVLCVCIFVFYFRHIKLDAIIIGYIFTWLALVDILLQDEKDITQSR